MTSLVLATLFFLGIHLASSSPLRTALVARMGEAAWLGLFSLVSVLGIFWMSVAYSDAPVGAPLWDAGTGGRHLSLILVALAFLLLVPGVLGRNPTAAGQAGQLQAVEPATGVLRITRHPVMWGIGLWGIAHLVNNSTPADLVFFGGLTVLAVFGPMAQDAKFRALRREDYARYTAVTSYVPFGAVLTGRQKLLPAVSETGPLQILAAGALYFAVLFGHGYLFGVSPLAM
ncbi:MAG: NnrU family protein [Actinomycetes bacterium]|nr:NnrU family protein [Actinomycetes bacterium]